MAEKQQPKIDRIPPVAPEGCAWMPIERERSRGPEEVIAVCGAYGWTHGEWPEWAAPAARLMRRLGPDEDPAAIEGAVFRDASGAWHRGWAGVLSGNWYAPVCFVGHVPDFGERGLRLVDSDEVVDEYGCVPTEQGPALPIVLPALPGPERESQTAELSRAQGDLLREATLRGARVDALREALHVVSSLIGVRVVGDVIGLARDEGVLAAQQEIEKLLSES